MPEASMIYFISLECMGEWFKSLAINHHYLAPTVLAGLTSLFNIFNFLGLWFNAFCGLVLSIRFKK